MNINDSIVSVIRTTVPAAVGASIYAASDAFGLDIDAGAVAVAASTFTIAVYYAVVRALEKRFPQVGWALGLPKPPSY